MIRLVRLSTGPDGQSHVEEGALPLDAAGRDLASSWMLASRVRFEESPAGSALDWHVAPRRQFVITLSGTLEFVTRGGETFRLAPGDVLLAEDTAGGGHRWRLVDDQPWRRVYVELPPADAARRHDPPR
ncbi:MAG TPA: cupin domain-containing protein [Acidimicrobiia bacterium]|nr:cupin domain-containing protein [Acidimicrobiia bacterium]